MFIFCNKCFEEQIPSHQSEFFMSTCGHVFCNQCVSKTCYLCQRSFNGVAVNKDMKRELSVYFDDPLKQFKRIQQIMQFQSKQYALYFKHTLQHIPNQMERVKRQTEGLLQLEDKIKKSTDDEKVKTEKLKEYINYYERRREQLGVNWERPTNSVTDDSRATSSSSDRRFVPKTPTFKF